MARKHGTGTIYFDPARQRWIAQVKINGKRKAFFGATEQEATARMQQALATAVSLETWLNEQPAAPIQPEPIATRPALFADLVTDFIKTQTANKWAISTQIVNKYLIDKHIVPAFGHLPITDINPFEINAFQTALSRLASNSRRTIMGMLASIFRYAVNMDLLERSPTDRLPKMKRGQKKISPLSKAQQQELIAATQGERLGPTVLLAMGTGMRKGEIFALHWPDINWIDGTIAISKTIARGPGHKPTIKGPKTEAGNRVIVLTHDTLDMLQDHRLAMEAEGRDVDQGIVFPSQTGHYLPMPAFHMTIWRRILKKLSYRCRFHDLRHTHASHLLNAGWPMHDVQHRLGHGSVLITMGTYGHMIPKDITDERIRLTMVVPTFVSATNVQPNCNQAATA